MDLFHRVMFGFEALFWTACTAGSIYILVDRLQATEGTGLEGSRVFAGIHILWHLVLLTLAIVSIVRAKGLLSGLLEGHPRWVVALLGSVSRTTAFGFISVVFWLHNQGNFALV